ncbi:Polymer-forming cytoskeletal [Entomobacter blattae]|uniref:Polymer-forming cytoskeletal n=2 Tax=Entomobacter blattae TaxID=2762277 RepID=A0A7H1NPX9_9PROT|nr:Polymer-forming cytoskeletal [Entomobacter blattae]
MNRPASPFPSSSPLATPPTGSARGVGNTLSNPTLASQSQPNAATRRTLTVGLGISVKGNIENAEQLVVEGEVEAENIKATEISIAKGGVFRGNIEVENAEIYGKMDGTLTASKNLTIHSTGQIVGHARCKKLQVEEGGQVSGQMEMITETSEKSFSSESSSSKKETTPAPSMEPVVS